MDWWIDYFAEVWEPMAHLIKRKPDTVHEADFIDHLMQEFAFTTLLDVPCGAGRIALEMARRGYEVCGADFNPLAIQKAQAKAQKIKKNQPQFVTADMRKLVLNKQFEMVVCIYNSFGYFTDAENEDFIASVSRSLLPGGYFLLEAHVLETLLPVFTPKEYWRYEDYILLEERTFDVEESRLKGNWTLIDKDGTRKNYTSSVRVYAYRELIALLSAHGFDTFEPMSSYYGDPFNFGDDIMLLLAKKQA